MVLGTSAIIATIWRRVELSGAVRWRNGEGRLRSVSPSPQRTGTSGSVEHRRLRGLCTRQSAFAAPPLQGRRLRPDGHPVCVHLITREWEEQGNAARRKGHVADVD